jgi:predicted FMN-binding regulatory protein PaiB
MYVPKAFAADDLPKLQDFMEEFNFATVVTQRNGELTASHIPFLLDRSVEPYGVLRAHVAIRNPQLQDFRSGSRALIIFQGPHTYISPSWYVNPRNVPTWNYTVVHAYGVPKMLDQAAMVALLKSGRQAREFVRAAMGLRAKRRLDTEATSRNRGIRDQDRKAARKVQAKSESYGSGPRGRNRDAFGQ